MRNSSTTGDDILRSLGLERRRSPLDIALPAVAVAGAGILIGVGIGLLLAPRPGRELRQDVERRLSERRGLGLEPRRDLGLGERYPSHEEERLSESLAPGSHIPT